MTEEAPRYAGLQQVHTPGFSVAESVERLRRFAYVEYRSMLLQASRIVTLPERDAKILLGRLQYEDAQHANALRARVLELRTNRSKLEGPPDPALASLFDTAEHLPGSYPFLHALVTVIKPAQEQAYMQYLARANDLADYGSVRLLRQALADEQEHLRLLRLLLATLRPDPEDVTQAASWAARLESALAAAGGCDGSAPRQSTVPLEPAPRYQIPHALQRDRSLPRVWDFAAPVPEQTTAYLDYMLALRLSEINVAEGLAIVLFETEGMPWSFSLDISRHLWDEIRHSLFGEATITSTYGSRATLPMRDYEAIFALEAPPLEQYAVLGLEVEGKNMKYPPGKRQEWEFARDAAQHPLLTTFQDFDWADEVLHVNIARRQLDTWFPGGLKAIGEFARRGKEHRAEVKHRQKPVAIAHPTANPGGPNAANQAPAEV